MKFLAVLLLSSIVYEAHAACNRPVDAKEVVVMMSFHEGSEEEKGAIQGACARGETLLVLPTVSAEAKRARAELNSINDRIRRLHSNGTCEGACQEQVSELYRQSSPLRMRLQELKPDYRAQLNQFLQRSNSDGTKVTSLILSGHDGGGHYYGDAGETTMAEIAKIAKENQSVFADTSSLLLMGCWTATPDQVEQWKVIFPNVRLMGGFVGSAPASTRTAAGTYISGLLRGERNLPENASRASVQAMINTVQHINMVTAGVYINPSCDENEETPSYYYVSAANGQTSLAGGMRPGLNNYAGASQQQAECLRMFGGSSSSGTYDWTEVLQYFQGEKEPENNDQLRNLYSTLRNNEHCFNGTSRAPVMPEAVLMLRFFQDAKKNFAKYFKDDLEDMYKTIDGILTEDVQEPELREALEKYRNHVKLKSPALEGMSRKETLKQISELTRVYDLAFRYKNERTEADRRVENTMNRINTHLHGLRCMPATWHDYAEEETLSEPTCSY